MENKGDGPVGWVGHHIWATWGLITSTTVTRLRNSEPRILRLRVAQEI